MSKYIIEKIMERIDKECARQQRKSQHMLIPVPLRQLEKLFEDLRSAEHRAKNSVKEAKAFLRAGAKSRAWFEQELYNDMHTLVMGLWAALMLDFDDEEKESLWRDWMMDVSFDAQEADPKGERLLECIRKAVDCWQERVDDNPPSPEEDFHRGGGCAPCEVGRAGGGQPCLTRKTATHVPTAAASHSPPAGELDCSATRK